MDSKENIAIGNADGTHESAGDLRNEAGRATHIATSRPLETVTLGANERWITDLIPHRLNLAIYGEDRSDGLLHSIRETGVVEPLLITRSNKIISGHVRWRAVQEVVAESRAETRATIEERLISEGLSGKALSTAVDAEMARELETRLAIEKVPVTVTQIEQAEEIELLLLECNRQRQKTTEQLLREFEHYLKVEAIAAKERKGQRTDLRTDSPAGPTGRARDFAAKRVGLSGTTAANGLKVLQAMCERSDEKEVAQIEKIRKLLNERSIDAAYKEAENCGWILRDKKSTKNAKSLATSTVNPTGPVEQTTDQPRDRVDDESHPEEDPDCGATENIDAGEASSEEAPDERFDRFEIENEIRGSVMGFVKELPDEALPRFQEDLEALKRDFHATLTGGDA
jgi:hypothetical protein